MGFYTWLAVLVILIVIGVILDREIYFYEGAHLGPRVQAWLYDRWARKYDQGKHESQLRDAEMLARPLLELTKDTSTPFILDFATGTGRLSYALLNQPEFNGHIVALDLSQGMLEQAAEKLSNAAGRVEFLRHQQLPLPFPDASFDVVCALEVLELFSNMDEPLVELTRVLRPGGILLTSRGTEESGRKAQVKSKPIFTELLTKHDLKNIGITTWWKLFDRVFAQKNGASTPVGAKKLTDVLCCTTCGRVNWLRSDTDKLKCNHCSHSLPITSENIVLN
jgi:ubiquinone/menaquinone biosynthesis C-methylase UbiE